MSNEPKSDTLLSEINKDACQIVDGVRYYGSTKMRIPVRWELRDEDDNLVDSDVMVLS